MVAVATLCVLAIVAAAVTPAAAHPVLAVLDSAVTLPCAAARVGCPPGIGVAPHDAVLADRPPARAPPLA
jgi:hypothetical protein